FFGQDTYRTTHSLLRHTFGPLFSSHMDRPPRSGRKTPPNLGIQIAPHVRCRAITSQVRPLATAAGATHQALLVSALLYLPPPPKGTGKFHPYGDQILTLSLSRLLPKQPWGLQSVL
ncbi:unnamed protein product, partial [Ectocarpus sp. 8 AP-2014]